MNRLKTVLKDRSGQGTPMILAVVVCCLILACVVFEYMRLMIVAQGVRDSVQSAIVAVATENWDEAYPGLREGYSGRLPAFRFVLDKECHYRECV